MLSIFAATTTAFVLPGPVHAPVRTTDLAMNEAAAKRAWLAKLDAPSWGPKGGAALAVRSQGPAASQGYAMEIVGRVVPSNSGQIDKVMKKAAKAKSKEPQYKSTFEDDGIVSAFGGPGVSSGW